MATYVHLALLSLCLYACLGGASGDEIVQLTSENWSEILTGEWMVEL